MGHLSLVLSFILIGIAVFTFVKVLFGTDEAIESFSKDERKFPSGILKLCYPVMKRVGHSVSKWNIIEFRKKFTLKIASAGLGNILDANDFYSWQIAMAFLLPFSVYAYNFLIKMGIPIFYLPFFALFGWFYPRLWIDGIIKKRRAQIKREMPFVVDLLTLCVEAGLDLGGAMGKVVEKGQRGPFREEVEQVLKEVSIGSSRAEALKNMSRRIDMKEMTSLVAVLVTAERMGSPIGQVLRAQADTIRAERFTLAEKKGGEASVKIMLPMIMFIMPAVFIAIFGPFLLAKIYGGGGGL